MPQFDWVPHLEPWTGGSAALGIVLLLWVSTSWEEGETKKVLQLVLTGIIVVSALAFIVKTG